MHDLIQIQIVIESGHLINKCNYDMIFSVNSNEILKGLWKAHPNPANFKKQMHFNEEIILRDIIHLKAESPIDDEKSMLDSD